MKFTLSQYLDELAQLVNIDSVSSEPVGAGQIAAFFKKRYEELGWYVKSHSFSSTIGPCLEISNKPFDEDAQIDVLLLAHMDTVFPVGTAAQRPFTRQGDRAFGPGIIDCKAGLLSGLYALTELHETGALKDARICVFLNSDHEGISSKYSHEYSVSIAKRSLYVLVLESARANGNLVHKRKGIARYHLTVKGVGAHAGVDYAKGRSAVEELAHWILALQGATNLELETTVNVGLIEGGSSINAIPGEAKASVDIRYYDTDEVTRIEKLMDRMAQNPHVQDTHVIIEGGITRPPMIPSEKTNQLCSVIDTIGHELKIPFGWTASGGGSDGSFSAFAGIPTIDGLGPVGGGAHSVGEYLEIPTVEPRLRLLKNIIVHILHSSAESAVS